MKRSDARVVVAVTEELQDTDVVDVGGNVAYTVISLLVIGERRAALFVQKRMASPNLAQSRFHFVLNSIWTTDL